MTRETRTGDGSANHDSLIALSDSLVAGTQKILRTAKTEEDLRIGFEKLLEPILRSLQVQTNPRYERSIFNAGRSDALHGQVVIEYEVPGAFSTQRGLDHAIDQLVSYLQGLSQSEKETLFIFESKFVGVGFDGSKVFFVRYAGDRKRAKTELRRSDFASSRVYEFDSNSAQTLLTHLRALARLPLTAENLAEKLGPRSDLAIKAVSSLANALEHWGDEKGRTRVHTFYDEWRRLFGIVYGEQFIGHQEREREALAALYKVGKETDFQKLLFAVHTYFALLMKLIAAELLTLRETSFTFSLTAELAHLHEDELRARLDDIESGGVYARKGITNFLEGDFFRWYLDAWSPRLKEAIQEIARTLSDFEPATSSVEPGASRDLLKRLYQYLLPPEVRHRLGEYYTPDWLAELILNEVSYDGNTLKRLLDPACGSGTFLVLAIQRAKEHGQKQKWPPLEIAKRIIANIWGFDLNPLAVIAARTNYLFALGDLARELETLEIPIYLADSVLWPEQVGVRQEELNFHGGDYVKIRTSVKEFRVPAVWIHNRGFLMKEAAPIVERLIKNRFEPKIAMKHLKEKGLLFPPNEQVIESFYIELMELERENKNGIWARFLKNAFAPMVAGKFDFVVGNPPWVRWGYLSQEYRQATVHMWKDYGLFSLKGHAARLGGGEKDFSMLFAYASADYYLDEGAKLGFLITQEVFKSKGAGEGFRRFRLGESGRPLRVLKAHDLVTVQPFEGAANKTAAIVLKKGSPTRYPVTYTVWTRRKRVGKVPTDLSFDRALPLLQRQRLSARPIGGGTTSWQTVSEKRGRLDTIEGECAYKARLGARVEPYGVFWLDIVQVLSDGNVIIRNLFKRGKREVPQIEERIEPDLVYPLVSGANINRWVATPVDYVLISQDSETRAGYREALMKAKWPRTYEYLLRFKDLLVERAAYRKYHAESHAPFYSQYNIARYSLANYKVVWKRMSNDLIAAVVSQHKTPLGYKTIIPTDTTSLIATKSAAEAHYLCAIINSTPVRDFVKSFSSAGRGFGTPSVMEHIGIPKFDPRNELHHQLAEISKKCHQLKAEGKDAEMGKLEKENDALVKRLFKIGSR